MVLISSLFALALPAMAPVQPPVAPVQEELISFSMKPVSAQLGHPKDAGLRRALELLPARIEALAVANGEEVPPGLIPLLAEFLTAGKTLVVFSSPGNEIPIQASLIFSEADSEKAAARNSTLLDFLLDNGAPMGAQLNSGLYPFEVPIPMPVQIGSMGNDFVITLGTDQPLPRTIAAPPLPAGVNANWEFNLDIGAIYEMIGAMAPDEEDQRATFQMLASILGEMRIQAASGTDADRSFTTVIQSNAAAMIRDAGAYPASGITARDLALIPADAQMAILIKSNLEASFDMGMAPMMPMLEEMGIDDPFDVIAQEIGLDIRADLFAHLGETMGFYFSNTTGGGTLASGVALLEIKNRQGMNDFLDRVCELMSPMLEEAQSEGLSIGQRTFTADGVEYTSMTFPGLPVPVEPTYAFLENWMVFGLSPQATRAAVWQIRSGGKGLQDNPRFVEQAQALGASDSAMTMTFFDTPALLADGYTWMNLAMGAITNGLRTNGASEDPGMLLDPFPILAQDAKAILEIMTYEGDDIVTRNSADASLMVNLTGFLGFLDRSGLMMIIPAAVVGFRAQQSITSAVYAFDDEPYIIAPIELDPEGQDGF